MKEREACIRCYKENMQVSRSPYQAPLVQMLNLALFDLLLHTQTLQRCINWPGHQYVKWLCRTP